MVVTFEKKYLEELFETGKCSDKKHRYQPDIIRRYAKCIYFLQKAPNIEALYKYGGLRYEILTGNKAGLSSVRVNDQYRIEFSVTEIAGTDEIHVTVCNILELSNHYK
ncbi:MAG: type II toxin-antitoxin system RelE/ParE family toxin [Tannerellaceae bacterium]|jgi:proteic killer suppression protein|nr:type II toxin-antitoxin system RelE/ParE family toxin [Tannerellaceae bacterium]